MKQNGEGQVLDQQDAKDVEYSARVLEKVETKPGCWNYNKIGIFHNDQQIGEYIFNYLSWKESLFYPFKKDEKWFALYSKHYMYTRVMSLPDCVDLGGEDAANTPYAEHFCPTGYFVPKLYQSDGTVPYPTRKTIKKYVKDTSPRGLIKRLLNKFGCKYLYTEWIEFAPEKLSKEDKEMYDKAFNTWLETCDLRYANFGFVSGCHWGDDSSSKIEFLDLREVEKGIIKRSSPYGYLELPRNVNLRDAIDVDHIGTEDKEWKNMSLYIAKPVRIQVDGSYDSWWQNSAFEKLKKRYPEKHVKIEELQRIMYGFFTRGLDDSSVTSTTLDDIEKLVEML